MKPVQNGRQFGKVFTEQSLIQRWTVQKPLMCRVIFKLSSSCGLLMIKDKFPAEKRDAAPPWMRYLLICAGLYNLAWGTFVVLLPLLPFQWAGMQVPRYPEIWQCVGMIVGVYGIGYIIAAFAPFQHWPIILVGLLGKVLGPVGMLNAIWHGKLPPAAGLVCLTNDLVWWLPFGLILWRAYQAQSKPNITCKDK